MIARRAGPRAPTRTPAASRSTPALPVRRLHPRRAATTTASGRCSRAGSRTTATRCWRVDLPGHGRSAGAAAGRASRRCADWLLALLDAAGVERAALVGHSMGSLIALEAAARAPRARAAPVDGRHGVSDEGLAGAARHGAQNDAAARRSTWSTPFSHLDASPASPRIPAPARGCTAATRALMRRLQAGAGAATQPVPPDFARLRSLRRRPGGGRARALPGD